MSELTSALVGTADSGSSLLVEIAPFDAADERWECESEPEPEPDLGAPTGAGIGTWLANPESVALVLEEAAAFGGDRAPALDVAGTTGDVLMTFDEGGTGTLTYDNVTFFVNNSVFTDLTISGSGTFRWGVEDGTVQISGTQFSFAVNSTVFGDEPLIITDADVPSGGVTSLTASFGGNQMTIGSSEGSAGEVFFPILWTRLD